MHATKFEIIPPPHIKLLKRTKAFGNDCADFLAGGNGGTSLFRHFSLECTFSTSGTMPRSIKKMIVSAIIPFLQWVAFMIIWMLLIVRQRRPFAHVFRQSIVTAYAVFYISYTGMAGTLLKLAICQQTDSHSDHENAIANSKYWMEDTDINCSSSQYRILLLAGGIPLILSVFGAPAWLLFVLIHYRERLDEPQFLATYGFFYKSYRSEHKYWEVVIMGRKALLFAIIPFSHSLGPNLQLLMAMGILFISLQAHSIANPFLEDGPNLHRMEAISLSCSILVFFAGLVFTDPKTSDAGRIINSVIILGSSIGTIIYLVASLVLEVVKGMDDLLLKWEIAIDGSTTFPMKIFLLARALLLTLKDGQQHQGSLATHEDLSLAPAVSMESQKMVEAVNLVDSNPSIVFSSGDIAEDKD